MTDYFAVLQQPRQPWLDEEAVKTKYNELTLTQHPDVSDANEASRDFGDVTQAYRVLSDPKLRLRHLLELGAGLPRQQQVPPDLDQWFTRVAEFIESANRAVSRIPGAGSAVALSLSRVEMTRLGPAGRTILSELQQLYQNALQELPPLNSSWSTNLSALAELYVRISFLSRWIEQVEEYVEKLAT